VAWVKTQGGKGAVGIPAPASTPEFLVKVVGDKFKLDLVSAPYRGSAPMMADMLGNQIAAGVGSVPDFIENHKAGKVRIVAVLGAKRQAALPDVPTFGELGLSGLDDMPEVHDQLTKMGLTVGYMNSHQLEQRERAYTQVWTKLIKNSGFQPQ
jgi:tripartite-type tricarboxylate transporter receptor subunit TctC